MKNLSFQKHLPIILKCTRFSSTNSDTEYPSLWKRTRINGIHLAKVLLCQPDLNIFNETDVGVRYIQDQIPVSKWCLVYDNRGAAVFHKMSAIGTPIIFFSSSLMALDYWNTNGDFSISFFGKFYEDCVDAGYFTFFPLTVSTLLVAFIMYLQGKQIFRIYVNRKDPTKFRILLSKGAMFRHWIEVNRTDIESTPMLYCENSQYFRSLLEGQIKIKNVKKYLDISNFRTNDIQSYLFRETEKVPSFIKDLDLDIEMPYKKKS